MESAKMVQKNSLLFKEILQDILEHVKVYIRRKASSAEKIFPIY